MNVARMCVYVSQNACKRRKADGAEAPAPVAQDPRALLGSTQSSGPRVDTRNSFDPLSEVCWEFERLKVRPSGVAVLCLTRCSSPVSPSLNAVVPMNLSNTDHLDILL
jgi:hypothetical protein